MANMDAQEYRAHAESMAKQAEAKATASAVQAAMASAAVANVWTFLYKVQSKNDRTPPAP